MKPPVDTEQIRKIQTWLGSGSINFFGLPFAGKDTQAKRIAALLDAPVIGGGEIMRTQKVPVTITKAMNKGQMAPTEEYIRLILPYLSADKFKNKPLMLSAVGRWHGEEAAIMTAVNRAHHPIKAVIYLDMLEEEVWRRWEAAQKRTDRGPRVDDAFHKIDTRLDEFRHKTIPVIEFYRRLGLVIDIEGNHTPEHITHTILTQLAQRAETA